MTIRKVNKPEAAASSNSSYLQAAATTAIPTRTMGRDQKRAKAKAAAVAMAGSSITSAVPASSSAELGVKLETGSTSTPEADARESRSDSPQQEPQKAETDPDQSRPKLPKVTISSLKRTASPAPSTPMHDANNDHADSGRQLSSSGDINAITDGTGASAPAAAKRLKTSPEAHLPSKEKEGMDTRRAQHLSHDQTYQSDEPLESGMQTQSASTAEEQITQQLAQKLADAPGPPREHDDQPGWAFKASKSLSGSIPSSAPTPGPSPAKPQMPSSDAERGNIATVAAILEQGVLSAEAKEFKPQGHAKQSAFPAHDQSNGSSGKSAARAGAHHPDQSTHTAKAQAGPAIQPMPQEPGPSAEPRGAEAKGSVAVRSRASGKRSGPTAPAHPV